MKGVILPDRLRAVGQQRPTPQLGILAGIGRQRYPAPLQLSPSLQKVLEKGQQAAHDSNASSESDDVRLESVQDIQQSAIPTPEQLFEAIDKQQLEVVASSIKRVQTGGSRIACGTKLKELLSTTDDDGNTMLHRCVMSPAADDNRREIADLLVSSKASVNSVNLLGETPLLTAVRSSTPHSLVQLLLEARADVGRADELTGETALMEASVAGDAELCCLLLGWEADPLQRNKAGLTAWDVAKSAGNDQIAALMPEAAVEPTPLEPAEVEHKPRALRSAVRAGDHAALVALLEEIGADTAEALGETDGSGRTLLHVCAELPASSGTVDVARCLLEKSACPNVKDAFGQGALAIAVSASCDQNMVESASGALDMVRVLLDARADASAEQAWCEQNCALHRATSTPAGVDLCMLLRERGARLPWFEVAPVNVNEKSLEADVDMTESTCTDAALAGSETQPAQAAHADDGSHCDAVEVPNASVQDDAKPEAEFQPPPRAARSAGLKKKCEENGIPLDALGMFGATDVLRELDRLRGLDLDALRKEARDHNLHAERCYDTEELISRLKQARIWKLLPLSLLQTECREKASQVVADMQKQDGVALRREDLLEALAVAMWGGSTRTQVIHELCLAKKIPIDRLPDLESASKLLEQIQALEARSLSDLAMEFKSHGFAPGPSWRREDFLAHLQEVLTWEAIPLSDLRQVCKMRSLQAKGEHRRADLMQLLASASWEARGVPRQRLPDLEAAQSLLDQVEWLEQLSLEELVDECEGKFLPMESKPNQKDLVVRLRTFFVWNELPIEELRRECETQGACGTSEAELDRYTRIELVLRLIRAQFLESKGLPVRRLRDLDEALELASYLDELQNCTIEQIRLAYEALGMPPELRLTTQQLLGRIRIVSAWDLFTTEELLRESQARGIETARSVEKLRQELLRQELQRRLRKNLCMESWKACGMPTERLGSYEQALKAVNEFDRLSTLDPSALRKEYGDLGLPIDNLAPLGKILERLQVVAIWRNLPMPELRKDCRHASITVPMVLPGDTLHRGLVEKLARAAWDSQPKGSEMPSPPHASKSRVPPPPSASAKGRPKLGVQPPPGKPKTFVAPKTLKAFETMHLPPNSNAHDVRKAFRQLALQYHPDKNPGALKDQAEQKFREVNDAYKELCSYLQMS